LVAALLLMAALVAGHAAGGHALAADPGAIDGQLPEDGGIAAVTWGGGTVEELDAAAESGGCTLSSAWVFVAGQPIGNVIGAPDFVNAGFLDVFPGGNMPADTILVLVCAAPPAGGGAGIQPIAFQPALGGRTFDEPVELVPYPGGRFLVAEQGGAIRLVDAGGAGDQTLLDLSANVRRSGSEEGMLSVQLDPAFAANGRMWTYYSPAGGERRTRLSRFTVSGDVANPASELVVLEVAQPYSNHNGGAIRFGPDGMLYLGLGDGGSGGDPQGHGQNIDTLLGSIIRIDVRNASATAPYVVPPDNPFVGRSGADEIWAYGLRNPWRMSFDSATGRLWAGDVGQGAYEEIDIITAGANYGWNRLEGAHCYEQATCSTAGTVLPVAEYSHEQGGCSVTGGVVARSSAVPGVAGAYLYADHCSGRVWAIDAAAPGTPVEVGRVDGNPTAFAMDTGGNVYIVQFGGPVLRVVPQ
jgi:glucose/arabinose dehydrogenase